MPETIAATTQANPNVLVITDGLAVSKPHLSLLMDQVWWMHDAEPFLPSSIVPYLKPSVVERHDLGGRVIDTERNITRIPTELALGLAPLAGELAMKLGNGEPMPTLTSDQVDEIKNGAAPLLSLLSGAGGVLSELSVDDYNRILPVAPKLDYVQARTGPYLEKLDKARRYIDTATSTGDQAEIGHQLHHEVRGLLSLIWGTARGAAAHRVGQDHAKIRRMQRDHDRYVTREDVAVGIKAAVEAVLNGDAEAAPMLHSMIQNVLEQKGKAGTVLDVKLNVELLDFAADLIVTSLVSALPKDERSGYRVLLDIAKSSSMASLKFNTILWASKFATAGRRQKVLETRDMSPALAKFIAEKGRGLYKGLNGHLPNAMLAIGGLFVMSQKTSVKNLYENLQRSIPAPKSGSAALD